MTPIEILAKSRLEGYEKHRNTCLMVRNMAKKPDRSQTVLRSENDRILDIWTKIIQLSGLVRRPTGHEGLMDKDYY